MSLFHCLDFRKSILYIYEIVIFPTQNNNIMSCLASKIFYGFSLVGQANRNTAERQEKQQQTQARQMRICFPFFRIAVGELNNVCRWLVYIN